MDELTQRRLAFNKLVAQLNKAIAYMDDLNVPLEEKEKHLPRYTAIIKAWLAAEEDFKKLGFPLTEEQGWNGFDLKRGEK